MHQQQRIELKDQALGSCFLHNPERAICQATVKMKLPDGKSKQAVITTDPCNSASMAKRQLLHNIKDCKHYNQQPIRMTTVQGVTPWYKEMGILKFEDGANVPISVLCYVSKRTKVCLRGID